MGALAIVHNRIDALTIAFRVSVSDEARRSLSRGAELARMHGRAALRVASLEWEIKCATAPTVFLLRREEHVRARVDLNAAGSVLVPGVNPTSGEPTATLEPGWTVEIVFYASHLAEQGLRAAIEEARAIARRFGHVHDARLRRIDLAADVAGWKISDRDRRALVRRSRVRTRIDPPTPDGGAIHTVASIAPATGHETRRLTGITVGKGDVVARIYDKREELRCVSQHKLGAEEERWKRGGWDGEDRVTRVEFQLRGEALRELGCRALDACHDPETGELIDLVDYVPRIWSSCLRWVRLVQRARTRTGARKPLTRCDDDPRWRELRRASWGYASPIRRKRERGGATSAQALGSVLSVAAARGKLDAQLSEDRETYRNASTEQLKTLLAMVAGFGVDLFALDMIERWESAENACLHLAVLWNAARARFARVREKERVTPWLEQKSRQGSTRAAPLQVRLSTD